MENKFQFVRDGVIRYPPGFRFQPTDEELVFQYLRCKIFSFPLPAPVIPDINICKYDPWDLPGDLEQERYFFSNKEAKYPNGNRINRATASGNWKATGLDKQIVSSSRDNQMVGMKKTLVFYRGKSPHESTRTDWIMHEYRLVSAGTNNSACSSLINSTQNYPKQMDNWVVCRVFLRKRSTSDGVKFGGLGPAISSSSSSSSFSGISEASCNGSDYDEESSSNGNF